MDEVVVPVAVVAMEEEEEGLEGRLRVCTRALQHVRTHVDTSLSFTPSLPNVLFGNFYV